MLQNWVDVHRPMGFETETPENARVFLKTNQKIKKITHMTAWQMWKFSEVERLHACRILQSTELRAQYVDLIKLKGKENSLLNHIPREGIRIQSDSRVIFITACLIKDKTQTCILKSW